MKRLLSFLLVMLLILTCTSCTAAQEDGEDDGFIRGMDVSSLLAQLNSGVTYYDFEGNALDGPGFMALLESCGVNWIRLRLWNDPYNTLGQSYGGGNCDLATAVTLGRWATDAGMRVLIDFHYSDFWADPGKQFAPKAWAHLNPEEKSAVLAAFTQESLKALLDAGVDVGMVQIGNEINNGLAGETDWAIRCDLLKAGAGAVESVEEAYHRKISIAVHFTDPQKPGMLLYCAENLAKYNVTYDIFATSYYPYWHGTTENLTIILKEVADTYGKSVLVAETAWPYTLSDGDGHTNSVVDVGSTPYSVDVAGQAAALQDTVAAVKALGDSGIGVFYWEPAWIPVGRYDGTPQSWQKNAELWNTHGSGWASVYAGSYDPENAGQWHGGSSWDNQALFSFDGHPLESLKLFLETPPEE